MPSEAEEHLTAALAFRRQTCGDQDPRLAESLDAMGRLAKTRGDYAAAEGWYREALERHGAMPGDDAAGLGEILNDLGVVLKVTGRLAEAEEMLRRALAVRRALVEEDARGPGAGPAHARSHQVDEATTLTNLAAVLKNRSNRAEAADLYRQALRRFRDVLGPDHYRVAVCLNNLALLWMEEGCYGEAESMFREALAVRRHVFGDEHLAVATGLKNLALLLVTTGRYEEAEGLYREALRLGRILPGNPYHPANTLNNLADLLATVGRYEEAEPLCREGLAIRRAKVGSHPRLAGSLFVLGRIRLGLGDAAEAEMQLRESVDLLESGGASGTRTLARARGALGEALLALGRSQEAEPLEIPSENAFAGGQAGLPFWDDIDDKEGGVFLLENAEAFIVQWNWRNFDGRGGLLQFEIKIFGNAEPTGIYAQFIYRVESSGDGAGGSATIGYQDGGAGFGDIQFSFDTRGAVHDGTVLSLLIPSCHGPPCPADLDCNHAVDTSDLLALLAAWGGCGGCPEDLDGDGVIGFGDLLIVLAAWGPCP